jgi:hypothetical protein
MFRGWFEVIKMVTVLEECAMEEQWSSVHFLWAKGLTEKDIHKEMFPIYNGKHLSCKAVHNWAKKCGICFTDDEEVETEMWKWLRQQQSKTSMLRVSMYW